MFDRTDIQILEILQKDARVRVSHLAKAVGMTPSGVSDRMRRLEACGMVRGFTVILDPRAAGVPMAAFLHVRAEDDSMGHETARRLAEMPEVQEVHHVAGDEGLMIKVRARDPQDLSRLIRDRIGKVEGVKSVRSSVVLETVKELVELPVRAYCAWRK